MAETPPNPTGPAPLTDADVRRVARLARVAISEADIPALRAELGAVLAHADALRALDLTDIEPMTSPVDAVAPMRDDTPGPAVTAAEFLAMAPETTGPYLKVPKVLGESSA